MWTLLLALALALESAPTSPASGTPCPAGAAPRIAFPCYPDPSVWTSDNQKRLPADGIYILLDQAPEWPEGTSEVDVPAPVSGQAYSIDGGDFVPLAQEAVVGRGRTVRIGEHWNVWLRGKAHEVEITGFARLESVEEDVRVFDELYATARMPPSLRRIIGSCADPSPTGGPGELLAAPVHEPMPRGDASPGPAIDERGWRRSFQKNVPEHYRPLLAKATIERHEIVQCGETRVLAVLNLNTGNCGDYSCDNFSQVRIYGTGGRVVLDGGFKHGLAEAQVADVNGDGSDEILVCNHHMSWHCDILRVRDGHIVRDSYVMYGGC
jgi:hypothetical protein